MINANETNLSKITPMTFSPSTPTCNHPTRQPIRSPLPPIHAYILPPAIFSLTVQDRRRAALAVGASFRYQSLRLPGSDHEPPPPLQAPFRHPHFPYRPWDVSTYLLCAEGLSRSSFFLCLVLFLPLSSCLIFILKMFPPHTTWMSFPVNMRLISRFGHVCYWALGCWIRSWLKLALNIRSVPDYI